MVEEGETKRNRRYDGGFVHPGENNTDDALSEEELDVYLNRTKGRSIKPMDALTIYHQPPHGLVGVGAS